MRGHRSKLSITVNLHKLGLAIKRRKHWIRVKDLALEMGVSTKTAGRILVELEKLGYVKRRGNGVYKVVKD